MLKNEGRETGTGVKNGGGFSLPQRSLLAVAGGGI